MRKRLLRALILFIRITLIAGLIAAITPFVIRAIVGLAFAHRTYTAEKVPARRVAIILGAQALTLDYPSAMLADRVATGAALYHAGKVEVLLMTGDNSVMEYNEPETMRRYAMGLGVPDSAIVLDNASFHTSGAARAALRLFSDRLQVLWLPAYCPFLNPIERFWLHLKDLVCANFLHPSLDSLELALEPSLLRQNDLLNPDRFSFCKHFQLSA